MATIAPSPASNPGPWYFKPFWWLLTGLRGLAKGLLMLWSALALNFSNLPWASIRLAMALAFFAFGVYALFFSRTAKPKWLYAGLYLALLAWWATIQPSHDRNWRPEVSVMPKVTINGDNIHITGFRHFQYRDRDDFDQHWEERDYQLSHLTGLDFYVSYWQIGPVAHTFLSFIFDNAPPLCVSIETRPEVGEGFDPLASLFKQFELIYVVGDERDLVKVRTHHRKEDVFLYHINVSRENARGLLEVYLKRINELHDQAEFYHLLTDNCTLNIIRYANKVGRQGGLELRHILNGWIDGYLYDSGRLSTEFPFEELRRRSWINETSKAAGDGDDFYEKIRAGLPAIQPIPSS